MATNIVLFYIGEKKITHAHVMKTQSKLLIIYIGNVIVPSLLGGIL